MPRFREAGFFAEARRPVPEPSSLAAMPEMLLRSWFASDRERFVAMARSPVRSVLVRS